MTRACVATVAVETGRVTGSRDSVIPSIRGLDGVGIARTDTVPE